VAKKLGKSIDDLFCFAYNGELNISIWLAQYGVYEDEIEPSGQKFRGWAYIPHETVEAYLMQEGGVIYYRMVKTRDNRIFRFISNSSRHWEDDAKSEVVEESSIKNLFVMADDLDLLLDNHPELKQEAQAFNDNALTNLLDPQHPWHSEYLALAVKCWMDLFAKRDGNKDDNRFRPDGGFSKLIKEWLSDQGGEMGSTTKEHFSVIINPSKQGGPRKLPEE